MTRIARLRPIEPIPIQVENTQLVVLRDPMRFVTDDITVTAPAYMLLCLIDGERSVFDLQKEFKVRFGHEIPAMEIEKLIADLDQAGMLENQRFDEIRRKALEAFRDAPVREAAYAGAAYEGEAGALRAQIDGFYRKMDRQAAPKGGAEGGDGRPGRPVLGIVAPHIDPKVGGVCAAHAFSALAESPDPAPDLFVLLGTAHQPGNSLFTLTEKAFETPFGTAEVDLETARALQEACPLDLKRDEYLHKNEHSIEFQVIFLQHLYGSDGRAAGPGAAGGDGEAPGSDFLPPLRPDHAFKILPILVGSFHEYIENNVIPSSEATMEVFTGALRKALADSGKRVCFVVGADLSHMGKKFGDTQGPSDEFIESTRRRDLEMLEHVAAVRTEDFFRHLQDCGDDQKVCGLPPIYTMMNALDEGCSAELLNYDLSVENATESFVSFASLVFYSP